MKFPHYSLLYGSPLERRPSQSEEQAYISRMARTLVGSLGVDEARACVVRHHMVGLQPHVMAEAGVICLNR